MKRRLVQLAMAGCLTLSGVAAFAAQESQSAPAPATPPPSQIQESGSSGTQKAAPVVRRASRPTAGAVEQVSGPLTKAGTAAPASPQLTKEAPGGVATIRVRTRLVNVALNVIDSHGAPVGGFEKSDFRILEDGKPQTVAVFEREATSPLSIVLAIDSSETVLTSDRLEKQAARHFVTAILRDQDELDLMDFADTVREIVPFTNQAKRVVQGLNNLQPGDETALYNAVYLASQRLAETSQAANRRRVLVVISDGGDSIHGGEKYEQAIEQAQRAGAIIYSIIVVPIAADAGRNTGGEHALMQMSEDTGGKYYYVQDPSDLEPAFRHVSDDLRTQYLLGYYAPEGAGESAFRRIKVALTEGAGRDGLTLRYRTGYYPDAH